MPISQITILGTGLIGGSLARSLKRRGVRIVGWDRPEVLEKATELGVIDEMNLDPVRACEGSDVVVLATPVGGIIDLIERLGPLLPETTLLTDVGSTKLEILSRARSVFGDALKKRFLGGHPMAGKERSGIEQSSADIFQFSTWIFISENSGEDLGSLAQEYVQLIQSLVVRVVYLSAEQHDRLCAWISHLPQMVSTALASTLLEEASGNPVVYDIGGRALREMTRIASSPYSMWRDVALTNADNIAEALHKLEQRIGHIRENLKTPELRAEFERANKFRRDK
jgi:prephenate dehydrogenase